MKIKEFFKDKNNVILAISAGLIALAVVIAIISTSVEKSRIENKTSEIISTTEKVSNKAPENATENNTAAQQPDTTVPPAQAGANVPGKYTVTTQNDPLGVRAKPSQDAERIYELPKGSEIAVSATFKGWAFVKVDGVSGWVNSDYLTLVEKGEAPKHNPGKYTIGTQDDPLGIRVKPEADAQRNGEVPKGEQVEVLTVCGEWGYVEYGEYSGWLSFQYLK